MAASRNTFLATPILPYVMITSKNISEDEYCTPYFAHKSRSTNNYYSLTIVKKNASLKKIVLRGGDKETIIGSSGTETRMATYRKLANMEGPISKYPAISI